MSRSLLATIVLGCAKAAPSMPVDPPPPPVGTPEWDVHPGMAFTLVDGPHAGKMAYELGLRFLGEAPVSIDELPGTFTPAPVAILATGARRIPSCTPSFAGHTTPYAPLFVDGPEVLAPATQPSSRDLLVIVDPTGSPTYSVGPTQIRSWSGENLPLAIEETRRAGAVDANLVVRFVAEHGPLAGPDALVWLDGTLQPPARGDGAVRARVAYGRHMLDVVQGSHGAHLELNVPERGCAFETARLASGALHVAWPEEPGQPLALWFGGTPPAPITRLVSVRYVGVTADDEALEVDVTSRFSVADGRLAARDAASLMQAMDAALADSPEGEQVWLQVEAIGPRGHRMSGEVLVGASAP